MTTATRSYIVTGAGGGIGGAACAHLLGQGCNILGVDISERRLQKAAERFAGLAGRFEILRSGIDSEEAGEAIVARAADRFGELHGLANIAGGMYGFRAELMGAPLSSIGLEYFRQTYRLNLETAFIMCKAVEPYMTAKGYGKIVNVGSIAAFGTNYEQGDVAYSSAKSAVIGMTRILNLAVGPSGIRVNCVVPGMVMSDAVKEALGAEFCERQRRQTTLGRFTTLEEIAGVITFLLGPDSDAIAGEVLRVAAGAN